MLEITIEYKGAKYWHNPTTRLCYLEIDCEECQFVRLGKRCGGWVKVEEDETIKKIREFAIYLLDYPGVSCGEWTTEPFVDEVYAKWIAEQAEGDANDE